MSAVVSLKDMITVCSGKLPSLVVTKLLDGEELINPIEVLKHEVSLTPRKGVNGVEYTEKEYSVWRGSQRVQAARQLGYTHIEGIVINV